MINIREVTLDDIDKIMKLEHESFEKGIIENKKTFINRISTFPEGFLIAENATDTIGYICSELWKYSSDIDAKNFFLNHAIRKINQNDELELYISSIVVNKKYRRKGYGNLLLNQLTDKIECMFPIKSIILIVAVEWMAAKNIYLRYGFVEIKIIQDFFKNQNSSDAIVMRKYMINDN